MATKLRDIPTVQDALNDLDAKPDNLRIWNAVCKTDPKHTKPVEFGRKFTAIDAHYQIMEATRQFGPIGEGWGYDTGEIMFEDGLVIVPVTLWHSDRQKTFGPIYGSTTLRDRKGNIDKDAPKKATTDALTKALSQLGFNADVFLGRFDDNKYVEELRKEFADTPANDGNGRDPTIPGITKIRNNLNKLRRDGGKATTLEEFNDLVHGCKNDLQTIKEAGHSLWTGMGEDWDGFRAWIVRRRDELAGSLTYQLLVSTLNECETEAQYRAWLTDNGDAIDTLDGHESRDFEQIHDARVATLKARADA